MLLMEICDVFSGYAFKSFNDDKNGMPVIKIGNINSNGSIDVENCQYTIENPNAKFLSKKGDIYIALSGATTGKIGLMQEEGYLINQRVGIVRRHNGQIPVDYLLYFLKSKTNKILHDAVGSAQPNISPKDISKYEFAVKSDEEMSRISNELNLIVNLIKQLQTKLSNYDEIIKSRFIELFMDCDRDKYPLKKWKEVVIIKHGKDYKKNLSDKGGYPVYGSGGFMGVYANNYLVNENSIIIGRKGTIDKPLFVKEKFWNVDTAFGIEVNKQILNPIFFYIRSTMYNLKAYSTSTTLPSMTKDSLREIEIGIPPLDLQNGFADFVEMIDKSKFVVQQQIKDLEELLDKKMDEYFGG